MILLLEVFNHYTSRRIKSGTITFYKKRNFSLLRNTPLPPKNFLGKLKLDPDSKDI